MNPLISQTEDQARPRSQVVLTSLQPAKTGGCPATSEYGASGPSTPARRFFSRDDFDDANRARRFGGRVLLTIRQNRRAIYVGRNADRECSICGSASETPSLQVFDGKRWLLFFLLALARKRYHQRKEGPCMTEPREYATKLAKLPDRIAAILGKTVAVKGDAWEIGDDQALILILDELHRLDDTLVERNKNKRLARRPN